MQSRSCWPKSLSLCLLGYPVLALVLSSCSPPVPKSYGLFWADRGKLTEIERCALWGPSPWGFAGIMPLFCPAVSVPIRQDLAGDGPSVAVVSPSARIVPYLPGLKPATVKLYRARSEFMIGSLETYVEFGGFRTRPGPPATFGLLNLPSRGFPVGPYPLLGVLEIWKANRRELAGHGGSIDYSEAYVAGQGLGVEPGAQPLQTTARPIKGLQDAYELHPAVALTPGYYAVHIDTDDETVTSGKGLAFFAVGSPSELLASRKADLESQRQVVLSNEMGWFWTLSLEGDSYVVTYPATHQPTPSGE